MNTFFWINTTTTVMCIIFLIILNVVYFCKKNMNNLENRIYRHLVIFTDITLSVSLIQELFFYFNIFSEYTQVLFKYTIVHSLCWLFLFLFYIFTVTHEHRKKVYSFLSNNITKLLISIYLSLIILFIAFLFIGFETFEYEGGVVLAAIGPVTTIYTIMLILIIILSITFIVVNKKETSSKKLVPFYLILPFGILAIICMFLFTLLGTVQPLFTIIIFIMFHTIENPDIKMVSELTLARDQAEKASQVKSEFLASMSHELRTPLNAIIGLADVSMTSDNVEDIHNDLKDIKTSSMKLLELIDGILISNNLDSNTIELNYSNYNLYEVLDSVIKNTNLLLKDKNVELKSRVATDIPNSLFGDKEKIKVILNNLLSNAVKYTDEGYIVFDVSGISLKDKYNLKISVSDTGHGISEEDSSHIFDRFYRSDENRDSDIEGTGLGLSITKSIVEMMDGKISVNSNLGEGTTFTVTLNQKLSNENNININDNIETL